MPRKNILALLKGGDRRSIGRSDEVAAIVSKNQGTVPGVDRRLVVGKSFGANARRNSGLFRVFQEHEPELSLQL